MTETPRRYLVNIFGPSVDAIRLGIAQAHELARETPARRIVLCTPTKPQMERGSIVDAIGDQRARQLSAGRALRLPDDVELIYRTKRTLRGLPTDSVVLAVYCDRPFLDKLDSPPFPQGIVVVPWIEDEVERWVETWSPEILGPPVNSIEDISVDNPIVERALEKLTRSINLSTGLGHPSDKAKAVQIVEMLQEEGCELDPVALRAWAVRNGWSPQAADELKQIAVGIREGRAVRGGGEKIWRLDLIQQIKNELRVEEDSNSN